MTKQPAKLRGKGRRGLRALGHIDRYVGSLFLSSYATACLLVVGLFLILDMASNLDDYLEAWPDGLHAPTRVLVRFYLLNLPFLFLQVAPFVTLVAGLFTVSRLVKHREAIAALAAGVSSQRLLAPVFVGGFIAAGMMFWLREEVTAKIGNTRDALLFVLEEQSFDRVYEDLWVRDLHGSVVRITEFRPSTGEPPVAEIRGLEASAHTEMLWESADRAIWVLRDGREGWLLENGAKVEVVGESQVENPIEMLESFDFTPELALTYHRQRNNPLELSFHEVRELASRDPDNVVYQTLWHYHMTFPLANVVLLLVGLPVMMRHDKSRGAEGLATGCLLCIFYFSSDFVFRNLGMQGSLQPAMAAWVPVLFFGSLGLVLFDAMRS